MPLRGSCQGCMMPRRGQFRAQVEELFQAAQAKKLVEKPAATKRLAILDVKRATGIGIRMSGLRSSVHHPRPISPRPDSLSYSRYLL